MAYIAPEILLGQKYGHTAGAPFCLKPHDRSVAGIRVNHKCFVGFLLEYIVLEESNLWDIMIWQNWQKRSYLYILPIRWHNYKHLKKPSKPTEPPFAATGFWREILQTLRWHLSQGWLKSLGSTGMKISKVFEEY